MVLYAEHGSDQMFAIGGDHIHATGGHLRTQHTERKLPQQATMSATTTTETTTFSARGGGGWRASQAGGLSAASLFAFFSAITFRAVRSTSSRISSRAMPRSSCVTRGDEERGARATGARSARHGRTATAKASAWCSTTCPRRGHHTICSKSYAKRSSPGWMALWPETPPRPRSARRPSWRRRQSDCPSPASSRARCRVGERSAV